jgi:hypothetical protein
VEVIKGYGDEVFRGKVKKLFTSALNHKSAEVATRTGPYQIIPGIKGNDFYRCRGKGLGFKRV